MHTNNPTQIYIQSCVGIEQRFAELHYGILNRCLRREDRIISPICAFSHNVQRVQFIFVYRAMSKSVYTRVCLCIFVVELFTVKSSTELHSESRTKLHRVVFGADLTLSCSVQFTNYCTVCPLSCFPTLPVSSEFKLSTCRSQRQRWYLSIFHCYHDSGHSGPQIVTHACHSFVLLLQRPHPYMSYTR